MSDSRDELATESSAPSSLRADSFKMSSSPAGAFLATIITVMWWHRCQSAKLSSTQVSSVNAKISSSLNEKGDEQRLKLHQLLASNQKIYRFVLTGGPCSGKTTAMEKLQVFLRERGQEKCSYLSL